jgi:hypothetical protein
MTSNKEIVFFHQLDSSYMREGRISMNFVIKNYKNYKKISNK